MRVTRPYKGPRKPGVHSYRILVCDGCGDRFLRPFYQSSAKLFDFCDRDCFRLSQMLRAHIPDSYYSRLSAEAKERRKALARKRNKSPAKTIREDLAWMYEEIAADRRMTIRGYGGARWREYDAHKESNMGKFTNDFRPPGNPRPEHRRSVSPRPPR